VRPLDPRKFPRFYFPENFSLTFSGFFRAEKKSQKKIFESEIFTERFYRKIFERKIFQTSESQPWIFYGTPHPKNCLPVAAVFGKGGLGGVSLKFSGEKFIFFLLRFLLGIFEVALPRDKSFRY
jgi:hypothetical protein